MLGIGLRVGRKGLGQAAMGGFLGVALGAGIYEVVGAILLPSGQTTPPLPLNVTTRLVARLLVGFLAGGFAGHFVGPYASPRVLQAGPVATVDAAR